MRRTNTFDVRPRSKKERVLLFELLDAAAALYNELTYERWRAFFGADDVWAVDQAHYCSKYKGSLGSATAQQIVRKNDGT